MVSITFILDLNIVISEVIMLETVRYFLYIPENDIIGINGNNILSFLEYLLEAGNVYS